MTSLGHSGLPFNEVKTVSTEYALYSELHLNLREELSENGPGQRVGDSEMTMQVHGKALALALVLLAATQHL